MNTDENKKKIIMLFIALGLILSVIFGVTFSYLAPSINNVESNSTVVFNAGTIAINYENGQNQINASEVLPGWTSIKEFSLTAINNTTISTAGAMNYAIKLIVEKNTFNDGAITYSIEGENLDNNGTIAYVLPNSLKKGASEVILGYGLFDTSSDISKGVTHRYTLTMAFPNKTYESQNEDSGKTLSAHIIIANEGESTFSNLTIIDNNNNLNKTMILKNNTEYELPNIVSKAGAYFSGWNVESGNATINGNKITINGDASIKANYSSTIKTEFAYTGNNEKFVAPVDGMYKIELWGASPNNDYNSYTQANAAYGGYTAGNIELKQGDTLYVYVGGSGTTFNCCTSQGNLTKSGGATDVRLINGEWNNATSLNSRIMVAGGGGTSYRDNSAQGGSNAGGLSSYKATVGNSWISYPSNQTSSGTATSGTKGGFGYGGVNGKDGYSSGAGGYWGGSAGPGGAGGSSFISGHTGCVAITSQTSTSPRTGTNGASCTTGTTDNLCSVHYSNKVFTDTVMIDGAGKSWTNVVGGLQLMPNYSGGTYASGKGNSGDGYAKITVPEIKEVRDLSTITVVSESLKKVVTIEAEKGVETIIPISSFEMDGVYFKNLEVEKGTATIDGTKIIPTSDKVIIKINYYLYNLDSVVEYAYVAPTTENNNNPYYIFEAPKTTMYKVETWGAQGGGKDSTSGGYGAYTSGMINLNKGEKLYIYVGENLNKYVKTLSYNGGGSGSKSTSSPSEVNYNGGGATDVRYFGNYQPTTDDLLWNSTLGLNSRIMSAGGGGGYTQWSSGIKGGNAGGLVGYDGNRIGSVVNSTGGTQTSGGVGANNFTDKKYKGSFGIGGYSTTYSTSYINVAGGGGGYYGGGSGGAASGTVGSAAGGSSFISGHTGCVAITSSSDQSPRTGTSNNSCETSTTDNLCSIHYSNKIFKYTLMIDGSGYKWTNTKAGLAQIPNPAGGYYDENVGNIGNGYARISIYNEV